MTHFTWYAVSAVGHTAIVIVCCAAFELMFPYERQGPWSRLRGVLYWLFFILGSTAVYVIIRAIAEYLGLRPLVVLDLAQLARSDNWLLVALGYLALPIPVLLLDFCYYWYHRFQHTNAFLWRFHSVHHAIEEMNAANSAHHPTEDFFRIPFLLPLALFVDITAVQVAIVSTVLISWGQVVHSNTRLSLGPLNYILSWPLFHRVHHSVALAHRNRNFASIFSFIDVLFGTAYMPRAGEQIRTGLDDKCEAKTLWQYFIELAPRTSPNTLPAQPLPMPSKP